MARWLPKILTRIRALAEARRVLFTLKARRELAALESGLDEDDACDVLASLATRDSVGRLESKGTGEWTYLFNVQLGVTSTHVKVIVRNDCIVISFHEDEDGEHEDGDET